MKVVMLRRTNSLYPMVAGMCSFFAAVPLALSNSPPNASGFYIVSVGFSDAKPGWHRSVLEGNAEGDDWLVGYIRVVPASSYCGRSTKIFATTTRLPRTSVSSMIGGVNL